MPWPGSRFSPGSALGRPIMGVRGEALQRVNRPFPGRDNEQQPARSRFNPPSRPGQRLRECGAGTMDWDQAVAVSLVHQNSVPSVRSQDHGDLAGYGDTRLLRSDAPRQPRSPCLEGRPALHFREKDAGSLIKTGAGKSVPAFRYPALPVRFSGLIPSRRQSEIGTDIPSPLEPVRFIDRGAECKGCYRPDARHRHEPSQRQVVADKTTDLLVQSRHLGNGNLPHFDQSVDERRQDRMVLGEHPCALSESTFVAASYDQTKGLQDTADLTINLDAHIDEPTANPQ